MAPRAFQARTQKDLAENLRHLVRRAFIAIHHRRAKPMRAASGSDHLTGKGVHWLVLAKRLTQPLIEHIHALESGAIRIGPHEVRPLIRPMIGVRGIGQQSPDHFRALILRRIIQKRAGLLQSRQATDGIQRGAAQEFLIRTQLAGQKPEPLELRIGQFIDEIMRGQSRVYGGGNLLLRRHCHARDGHLTHVTRHDRTFTVDAAHRHAAGVRHRRNAVVVRDKIRQGGDIALLAIRIMGGHTQSLLRSLAIHSGRRFHSHPLQRGFAFVLIGHAFADPLQQHLGRGRSRRDALPAFMRHGERGFAIN